MPGSETLRKQERTSASCTAYNLWAANADMANEHASVFHTLATITSAPQAWLALHGLLVLPRLAMHGLA
eukprot:1160256-Pelagomonas_calceolata.AAC.1